MPALKNAPDKWLFFLFCTLIVWAPLPLGSNRFWSTALLQAWIALIAVFLFVFLAQKRIRISHALSQSGVAIALLFAIVLWSAFQLVPLLNSSSISLDPGATFTKLQRSLAYGLTFICALQLVNTTSRLRATALAIVASGLFQSCYGLLVTLGGPDFDFFHIDSVYARKSDATGTFINRNHLAGYLEICLSVGIGLMIAGINQEKESGSWRAQLREFLRALLGDKARIRLFLVAMVIALVMTHSRMGNAAFFASMGISAAIGYLLYRKHSRSMVLLFGSMIAIDVFIVSSWFGLERLVNRIETTTTETEGRLNVAVQAWQWIGDHWLTGSGAGSFTTVFPFYRDENVVGFYDFAHNDFLQIWGEYGVIGATFFAGFALLTLWTAIRAQYLRKNPLVRGMAFAAMMALISLTIHSSTDFNLYIPANAFSLTLVCAFAYIARYLDTKNSASHRRRYRRDDAQPTSS